ncbi:MAG: hypothetical protein J6330_09400 [Clostridia bacterium]|nr:hypothetical protein [Clostridia bacterium]
MSFIPFVNGTLDIGETCGTLYFEGGYHSIPDGCKDWGSSEESDARFPGDTLGRITVFYEDGDRDVYPLVQGYTMWYKNMWERDCAPFKNGGADARAVSYLKDALYLYGAYECREKCYFAVKPKNKKVVRITLEKAENKAGEPVFTGVHTSLPDGCGAEFFNMHTVAPGDVPEHVRNSLDALCRILYTYEEDFIDVPEYKLDENAPYVKFSGDDDAKIATGVFAENMKDLSTRVDGDGFLHTSYHLAPSWWYNGFGAWMEDFNSYYNDMYSRDGGRALMTLSAGGYNDAAERGVEFGNRQMMYFPENNVTFCGHKVRGHYTVVINKPMLYSEVLTGVGWPTQYTEEKFGKDHKNLGNHETDGHGLMMMANCNVYKRHADPEAWADAHYEELVEAAEWIIWCLDNPELSFSKDGLLYAESEAGMNDHTLYCNLACYLGLSGYARIAADAGRCDDAVKWKKYADGLYAAILSRLSDGQNWIKKKYGFFHDSAVTFCSDMFGFDPSLFPEELVKLSRNSFDADAEKTLSLKYDGSGGLGYNTSMITQNALLLDRSDEADRLVRRLTRMSYAPRLPEPYKVSEGFSYSQRTGALRRQGDLGNLVQLAEALKAYQIVCGVSDAAPGTLQIFPRLPKGWSVDVNGMSAAGGTLWMSTSYPRDGIQKIDLHVSGMRGVDKISFRAGPFTDGGKLVVNGTEVPGETETHGGMSWIKAELPYGSFEIS